MQWFEKLSDRETWHKTVALRFEEWRKKKKKFLSEVGFEPTPSDEDHDLNVAP